MCRFAVKPPVDCDPATIHPAVPGAGFLLQRLQIGDAFFAEAWTGEQTDFDFRLMEPPSMRGRESWIVKRSQIQFPAVSP
jgi:hypothetical protein